MTLTNFRPRLLATATAATCVTLVANVRAESPIIDQGFAFQSIEWSGVSETGGTPNPKSDWTLKASYRVWGTFADRSVLRYFVKQKGKTLGEVRCETRSSYNKVQKNGLPHLVTTNCTDRNLKLREPGEYQLEWHLIDGASDADTLLGTDTLTVRAAPRYDLGSTTRPWYPAMYPDRNGELLSSVLYQRKSGFSNYVAPLEQVRLKEAEGLDVVVQAAPAYSGDDVTRGSHVRCRVDGQGVDLKTPWSFGPSSGTTTDEVWVTTTRGILAEAETPNPSGNPRLNKDPILFRTFYVQLPLVAAAGPAVNSYTRIGNHPGKWECDWRNDQSRTLRTFRFTVDAEGKVAPHEEQTAHGLSLAPNAVLVDTVIPGDDPLDVRTLPASLTTSAFNGRGLKSRSAQELAKAVPAKGTPLPPKYVMPAEEKPATGGKKKR